MNFFYLWVIFQLIGALFVGLIYRLRPEWIMPSKKEVVDMPNKSAIDWEATDYLDGMVKNGFLTPNEARRVVRSVEGEGGHGGHGETIIHY